MTSSQSEAGISLADQSQAGAGEEAVIRVVTGAMVDCRRDSLWQKLLQVRNISYSNKNPLRTMHIIICCMRPKAIPMEVL